MMHFCRKGSSRPLNIKGIFSIIVFLVLVLFICAGFVKQSDVKGKQIVLRFEPGPDNPRNSEGDFITLKDGTIFFVYSHYIGNSGGDHDPAFLAGRFSDEGGKSWGKIRNIEVNPNGRYCYNAIHFTRKDALLGYCAGDRTKGNGLAVTQITKLSIKSIYQ